jgi:hypothetical protein
VAAKNPRFNFHIDSKSVSESIKITYLTGLGIESVKKEFEDLLPVENEFYFKLSTTNMDLIEMALD